LIQGVNRYGRAVSNSRSGRWRHSKKGAAGKQTKKEEVKVQKTVRESRWYAADDTKTPIKSRKNNHKPARLRASITPGTIVIILAGRFKGKRVVFLKQLPSGLLLVTGPYKINGCPLRRINQAYVLATSTKIDVSAVKTDAINDDFFKKERKEKTKKDGEEFFKEEQKKVPISDARKKAQKEVDAVVLPVVQKMPLLFHYLNAKFSLKRGQYPHTMTFYWRATGMTYLQYANISAKALRSVLKQEAKVIAQRREEQFAKVQNWTAGKQGETRVIDAAGNKLNI